MYLVVLPHQWEANLREKSGLKRIRLGGAKKILQLFPCATYIFQVIHWPAFN